MLQLLNSTSVSFFLCLTSLVAGLLLLHKGIRNRRQGEVPHCSHCGYNITGLRSKNCPECGVDLYECFATLEIREKRPVLIILGCLLSLPSIILAVGYFGNVEWDKVVPAGLLISELNSDDPEHSLRMFDELNRRDLAGDLSKLQQSRWIDACLTTQKNIENFHELSDVESSCVDHLGVAFLSGKMTKQQKDIFLRQILLISIEAREKIVVGDRIPFFLHGEVKCPSPPFWMKVELDSISVDGRDAGAAYVNDKGKYSEHSPVMYFDRIEEFYIQRLFSWTETGKQVFTATFRVRVFSGLIYDEIASTLVHTDMLQVSTPFEIVEDEKQAGFHMIDDPGMQTKLQNLITAERFRFSYTTPPELCGSIMFQQIPVNVAFNVVARFEDHEELVGDCVINSNWGYSYYGFLLCWECGSRSFQSIDLILRSNETLVKESLDLYEAWEGEIVIKDVPVSKR